MNRAAIRETVFKILFRYEFHEVESFKEQIEMFFNEYPQSSDDDEEWPRLNEKAVIEITERVADVLSHIEEIDSRIEEFCTGWKIDRIGKTELSIIRVAVYEMLFDDNVETPVAISEAVKLSKKYCDDKSHSFVNGVLAKFVK